MAVVQRTVWGDVSAIQLHSLPRSRPQPEAILLEASYHIRESNCSLYKTHLELVAIWFLSQMVNF